MPALAATYEPQLFIKQPITLKGDWTLLKTTQPLKPSPVSVRDLPKVLDMLLKDRTTGDNIMWATDSYLALGDGFHPTDTLKPSVITQSNSIIVPRVEKAKDEQKQRTKGKAEVFTPTWIVKKQNDLVDAEYQDKTLNQYLETMWLEITCGEAPYMCSRYDTVSGDPLPIGERVGFVDRKLRRISREVDNPKDWVSKAKKAYRYSYGYEYQGDSLFLARENLAQTFIDYYLDKFGENPTEKDIKDIAYIISYNVFQMDGLSYTLPKLEPKLDELGFPMGVLYEHGKWEPLEIKVKIKNWKTKRMVTFESLTHREEEK